MHKLSHFFLFVALGFSGVVFADAVKDREGAVRQDRAKLEGDKRWIYDDYARGFAEAKKTGKPLLVVLRCVPCLACMGIDAQVLLEEAELAKRLDQFVCVRLINANALDLALFQFDYDLSFTTMFFNADGTVYGRYGSWTHQKNSQETATLGYRKALDAALAIHKGYPGNKDALAGKQGLATAFKTTTEIPMLAAKYKPQLDWEGKVVGSCVHCHMIGAAYQTWYRSKREPMPETWLHPWPEPETIGLTLVSEEIARVGEVAPDSPAAKAGLQAGDEIVSFNGQPLVSIADVSWALHRAPGSGMLAIEVTHEGKPKALSLVLPEGWRRKSEVTRRASIWPMRGMALGGLRIEPLSDEERKKRSIADGALALGVLNVGQYGMHAAAKKAGFQKEDVIVEIDGLAKTMGESQLIDHLLEKRFPGEMVKVVVLRGGQRKDLELPMQ
ncbi:MAG: Trx7/PDZ domain-containing (seleno)protein [Prosthecobacter sp.]|nr:Trx7/PDZ domain-containing (seleno)protein [Prosthecobacter sp.]